MTPGTWSREAGRGPELLIVDQFEEVFTLWPDESVRTAFLDELMDSPASVVIALRADFYGRCAEHPRLAAAVAEHQHLLGPMRSDELRRRSRGRPARQDFDFEAGLVDAMLADVEGEPGALPLLSHALYESWARRDGRVLTRPRATALPAACAGRSPSRRKGSSSPAVPRSKRSCGGCSSG